MIVTVDEVKTHLRIQHNEEDDYITGLIAQAQTTAEDYCRVAFEPEPDEEGNVPEVPEPVRLAINLMTSFYYENRDIPDMTPTTAMRMAFDSLLYPYRDPEKMF
ncbi:MAG: phage gp6-like head-tail connector protein [Clostridia bacterium]|nr:phage gp6-like head-tail connector protein [Clostridia bacterium]